MNNRLSRFPASWIPTLYIAEGLPYFAVNVLAVILYTRMGVGLKEMTFYTGFLYLPWVIKPFWSPFVDIFGTKRKWTLLMQFMIGICMAAIALALPFSFFFASMRGTSFKSVSSISMAAMSFFSPYCGKLTNQEPSILLGSQIQPCIPLWTPSFA